MFNWNDLRFLIEITRSRSLSKAAEKLGVRHTTVARRLQSLETAMGTPLLEKTSGGYVPTAAGAKLLQTAEQIESECLSVTEVISDQDRDSLLTGAVRLGVPEGFGGFLSTRVKGFYSAWPGLDLEMVAGTQFLSISKREADLAITLSRPRIGRLVARKLTDYRLQLYGAKSYLEQADAIRSTADLKHHTLIGYIDDLIYAPQLRYLDEILPEARVVLRTSSINAQVAAVASGLGLCVLPCFMAKRSPGLEVVLPDQISIVRTFWLSMHQDLKEVRRVTSVWDWLIGLVRDEQALIMEP